MEITALDRYQVIIIGAGPVGTVAAYRLATRGIDVLVVESASHCVEDLRASTFHPPTLDMMAELGVFEELDAVGLRAPVYQHRNRGTGESLSFDLGELADVLKHPFRMQCEQYKLARILSDRVDAHPHGKVVFSERALHVEQDGTGVTLTTETMTGLNTYRADYLIGADGANSIIRKWMGVGFDGFTYPERFLTLSTTYPVENHFDDLALVNYVADPAEWYVLLRVPSVWRILVPAPAEMSDEYLVSDAKKDAVFHGLLGEKLDIKTEHRTLYRIHQRVATTYRQGRVLLAGDACHLNNPLGGFGMNAGIHDAWLLTEKLSGILLDGDDPDPALDSYDALRRKVMHDFIQAQTINNKKQLEENNPQAQLQHQREMQAILADDTLRRQYLLKQSMVHSVQYD
jgi:3-(3-hydroxy-phenyl)propionate hydroxylase